MKRIVTYDIKESNDYDEFYKFAEQYNAKMLTESTYEFNTSLKFEEFKDKLEKVFNKGDIVFIISVSKDSKLFYKKIDC